MSNTGDGTTRSGNDRPRSGMTAGFLLAGAVTALALPSAVLAFSSAVMVRPVEEQKTEAPATKLPAATVDPNLAQAISMRMLPKGEGFRFTPAGTASRPDRSITVAVRVDSDSARAITVRKSNDKPSSVASGTVLRIAPTAYNLGVSRGYQAFGSVGTLAPEIRKIDMPDLAAFRDDEPNPGPSRFRTRIAVDEREKTGRAPGTFETAGQPTVDVGGSYRLTGNLNVTAGVRYSADRDRIAPLTDGQQDSQAVYLGTQFRF